jgi:hypothetical protein
MLLVTVLFYGRKGKNEMYIGIMIDKFFANLPSCSLFYALAELFCVIQGKKDKYTN